MSNNAFIIDMLQREEEYNSSRDIYKAYQNNDTDKWDVWCLDNDYQPIHTGELIISGFDTEDEAKDFIRNLGV